MKNRNFWDVESDTKISVWYDFLKTNLMIRNLFSRPVWYQKHEFFFICTIYKHYFSTCSFKCNELIETFSHQLEITQLLNTFIRVWTCKCVTIRFLFHIAFFTNILLYVLLLRTITIYTTLSVCSFEHVIQTYVAHWVYVLV